MRDQLHQYPLYVVQDLCSRESMRRIGISPHTDVEYVQQFSSMVAELIEFQSVKSTQVHSPLTAYLNINNQF